MIQPTKWSVPLGSGADVQDLPNDDLKYASFSKIFPQITQVPLSAGGVAPRRIDFNSLFKLLADNIYFYQNGGVFEYSNTADYEKGALVRYNDNIYLCIQDNSALNVHNPEDIEYWSRFVLNNELYDYVIESVVYDNGDWYRKYKSGWLEQGGIWSLSRAGYIGDQTPKSNVRVNFLKPYLNSNYTVTTCVRSSVASADDGTNPTRNVVNIMSGGINRANTTGFYINRLGADNFVDFGPMIWHTCGMGA